MISPSTRFFTASRSSLKLKTRLCSTFASFCVLSNHVLTRDSQDHRGGQTPLHRQRPRRRRHVTIRPILDYTSRPHARTVSSLHYSSCHQVGVVHCNFHGRVYLRKSIETRFALKTRHATCVSFCFFPFRMPTKAHVPPCHITCSNANLGPFCGTRASPSRP